MQNFKQSASTFSDLRMQEDQNLQKMSAENENAIHKSEHNQAAYQIRPQLYEKFKPLTAKEMIHNVLFDQLSTKTYIKSEAPQWCKQIADIISQKVQEMHPNRYKFIVNVVIIEQHGAGVKVGTRCIWDTESDSYAYDNFMNDVYYLETSKYLENYPSVQTEVKQKFVCPPPSSPYN